MIIAIDVGNSNIKLGGFDGERLAFVISISTDESATADEYAVRIKGALSLYSVDIDRIDGAIIGSVVPQLSSVIRLASEKLFGVSPIAVGPGVKTGVGIRCDMPSSVGADLIAATVAAHHIYGSPSLIVDLGTATKIIAVSRDGAFVGASIAAGAKMCLNALSTETAQLPKVSLDPPPSVIGRNTVDCMRSGIVFGHAAMIDGMIDRVYDELGEQLFVLATGGYASVILPHCKHKVTLDEHLVLKGLNIIYKKNK